MRIWGIGLRVKGLGFGLGSFTPAMLIQLSPYVGKWCTARVGVVVRCFEVFTTFGGSFVQVLFGADKVIMSLQGLVVKIQLEISYGFFGN